MSEPSFLSFISRRYENNIRSEGTEGVPGGPAATLSF
jgi:hypothetical protein